MTNAENLIDHPTRFLLFTGKGGVGKTSLACATAIALADRGRQVLLSSTDPASNPDEVLESRLGQIPTAVTGIFLSALNIDPEEAARAYRNRVVDPYRGILPPAAIASMEKQLSGACTIEIAAFDEFTKLFGDPQLVARGRRELPYISEVLEKHSRRVALVPWKPDEPVAPESLRDLIDGK
jgi:arsenite/tail-anchored protein-transporting ATPase